MASPVDVVMPGPLMSLIIDQLSAKTRLHKLWEANDPDALIAEIADKVRALAVGAHTRIDAALMDRFPNLEIVSNFGVGYDSVDVKHAAARGIVVTNTPDVLTEEVADTALGLLLMTVRELSASERWLRAGKWTAVGNYPLTQATLRDRRMGIMGLGRIGKAIARRAEACGVGIAYFGRTKQADVAYPFYDDLVAMARDVDILMCVLPGGAATRHLIDAAVLKALGPTGIVVNIGRGSTVDEQALIKALGDGTIYSAGLDVFEHEPEVPRELIDNDKVVLLPHVGSASVHTRNAMGQLVVDNITTWFAEGRALTAVAETPVPVR